MTANGSRILTPLLPKKDHFAIDQSIVKPLYRRGLTRVFGTKASSAGINPDELWPFTIVIPGVGLFFVHSETRSGQAGENVQSLEYHGTKDQILVITND